MEDRENFAMPEPIVDDVVACPYCWKLQRVEVPESAGEKERQHAAIMQCDCDNAVREQQYEIYKMAYTLITEYFGQGSDYAQPLEVVETLRNIARMIISMKVEGATINLPHGIKCKMKADSKGFLKVSVEYKQLESNEI